MDQGEVGLRTLCIGITKLTPNWTTILDQIGVWYEELDPNKEFENSYSAIILNHKPSRTVSRFLSEYLNSGGAVLEISGTELFFKNYSSSKVGYITDRSDDPLFRPVPFIDLNHRVNTIAGGTYFEGLVHFESESKGFKCFLGLNPDKLFSDNSYKRLRFYSDTDIYPDEIVSSVDKGKITQVIRIILKELHFRRGLPFINKWISPSKKPWFGFRIDSDYGDQLSIQELYKVGQKHDIPFTWFLHVEAHEDWLNEFKEFRGHEIALHGYEHGTSTSYEQVFNNIEKGFQLLQDAWISPKGFCPPYGIWNDTLAEVLTKFDFDYTSEFTAGYDALPFYPTHNGESHSTLQIPIHPICTGSLNRRNADKEQMKYYFEEVLFRKLGLFQPVIFYHHPLQTGIEVWDEIFKIVNKIGLKKLTFSEITSFWKERSSSNFEAVLHSHESIHIKTDAPQQYLQISENHDSFSLIKNIDKHELNQGKVFSYKYTENPSPEDIKKMRSNRLKLLKTSILDWRNRKKL
jgi:peptidoglycan/xylan/chitin deacetylase (PgdA/CDA1 family)